MSRTALLTVASALAATLSAAVVHTQAPPPATETQWLSAVDAWEAGDYPAALGGLRTLMASPAAGEYLERVALLTGELFVTTELTTDGRNPRISFNGEYATYEAGPVANPVTRLVKITPTGAQAGAELKGSGAAFDPNGARLAYIRVPQSAEMSAVPAEAPAAATAFQIAKAGEVVIRDLASGTERVVATAGLLKTGLAWSGDGKTLLFVGAQESDLARSDIYGVTDGGALAQLTSEAGFKTLIAAPSAAVVVYQTANAPTFRAPGAAGAGAPGAGGRGAGGGRGGTPGGGPPANTYGIVNVVAKTTRTISGTALTISADGSTAAWLTRTPDTYTLMLSPVASDQAVTVRTGRERIDAPALSPDGSQVAYQLMTHTDWEIYISDAQGAHRRLTRDIIHDLLPRFLNNTTLMAMTGEARHRRVRVFDLATGAKRGVLANNAIRTISPEYVWIPSADGLHLAIQAERDGDTVSLERGVYVTDLSKRVSVADVRARIDRQLRDENDLRTRMAAAFKPIEADVKRVVAKATVNRVYSYEKALFDFDSKHITQPGNRKAIEYLEKTYRSFGYAPVLQEFQPPQLQGGSTANVLATLKGTVDPHLIYVISSHFDSVAGGPGADDDTSGTAALLETARILADHPLPVTIVFASFTGEEAGLLGSREFVRRATAEKWQVIGALNNDMIGWGSESGRMDNTIRYSNAGIKDIQHGAAFLFTNLITYDAKYYKGTDANAFYDAWGDIVGGIGSYPVLSNPNYHQPTDFIETMNFRQIMETAKTTAATLMYLTSSPARLKDLKATRTAAGIELTWAPAPESGIKQYVVTYGPAANPMSQRLTATAPKVTLPALPAGTNIAVKAINAKGLEGWDWAKVVLQ